MFNKYGIIHKGVPRYIPGQMVEYGGLSDDDIADIEYNNDLDVMNWQLERKRRIKNLLKTALVVAGIIAAGGSLAYFLKHRKSIKGTDSGTVPTKVPPQEIDPRTQNPSREEMAKTLEVIHKLNIEAKKLIGRDLDPRERKLLSVLKGWISAAEQAYKKKDYLAFKKLSYNVKQVLVNRFIQPSPSEIKWYQDLKDINPTKAANYVDPIKRYRDFLHVQQQTKTKKAPQPLGFYPRKYEKGAVLV